MENIIQWKDKKLIIHEFKKSHANGGRLEKFWVEDINSGRQFLIKGSTFLNYEPLSEKIAYIIGKHLGIDVLEYDIIPSEMFKDFVPLNPWCKYVSICEKIDRKDYYITSVAEIKRAKNIVKDENDKYITNKEVMYELLDQKYIDTMILFDAIIGNEDRHYGNVHILRSKNGGMIGAPILDNGASLLAQSNIIIDSLLGYRIGEFFDKSSTVESKHNKQIEYIKSLDNIHFNIPVVTMNILIDIDDTLNLMPKYKATAVKKYLVYRLHKYLGLLKHKHKYKQDVVEDVNLSFTQKEKEHT